MTGLLAEYWKNILTVTAFILIMKLRRRDRKKVAERPAAETRAQTSAKRPGLNHKLIARTLHAELFAGGNIELARMTRTAELGKEIAELGAKAREKTITDVEARSLRFRKIEKWLLELDPQKKQQEIGHLNALILLEALQNSKASGIIPGGNSAALLPQLIAHVKQHAVAYKAAYKLIDADIAFLTKP